MSPAIDLAVHVRHRLVLTYAWPRELLEPMIPVGLEPAAYGALGFVAVALVHAERVRPAPLPQRVGGPCDLVGYRVLVRRRDARGRTLQGSSPLRGDADGGSIVRLGCLLTGGRYRKADIEFDERPGVLEVIARTAQEAADVHVVADLTSRPAPLPLGSPFLSLQDARRFGVAASRFHLEDASKGIAVSAPSARDAEPISVDVRGLAFFDQPPFDLRAPTLACAFHDADVEYVWERARNGSAMRTGQRRRRAARPWSPRPGAIPTPP
jgi:Uncharacterized conserved protein (COG2071)